MALDGQYSVMTPGDFLDEVHARLGDTPFTIVTPTPEALSTLRDTNARRLLNPITPEVVPNILAPVVGLLAARRARGGAADNSLTLDANYVRRTDAELKWKGL